MHGPRLAWASLGLVIAGAVMAAATVAAGKATVLYTFYPPLLGSPYYYIGILIAVIGSWIWVGLMISHFTRWKRDYPGLPVPLAMFATTAGALLWAWTSLGVGAEIVFLILPNAFGWTDTIDPGLARLLFSWTLHAIVYFWLIPSYIAFYVLLPHAAGGRLYSDKMGRNRVSAIAGLLDADRHSSSLCRSADRCLPGSHARGDGLQQLPRRERYQRRRGVPKSNWSKRGSDLETDAGLQERQA